MKFLSAVFLATLLFAGFANATITPILDSGNPTADGGNFLWTYNIDLSTDEQLAPSNSFFTIYDFVGYVGGTVAVTGPASADWTASVQLVGPTPTLTNPPDSASIENLVFTYIGPVSVGPQNFDGFSAVSTDSTINTGGFFSYQAQKTSNTTTPDQGLGPIDVPATATPEPASVGLLGGVLLGVAVLTRRKFARQ
jgi:hypothetical protein